MKKTRPGPRSFADVAAGSRMRPRTHDGAALLLIGLILGAAVALAAVSLLLLIGLILGAAVALAAVSLLLPKTYDPCDVNHDGKVNAVDLLLVQRRILGLDAGGVEYETTQREERP